MTDADILAEHKYYMRRTMEVACQNLQRPFGALLVDTVHGEVVAEAVNRAYRNPVAHSELSVIHEACRKKGEDVRWQDYTLYMTAEPCPMCISGVLWTGIPRVVYGSTVITLRDLGYRHIGLRAQEVIDAAIDMSSELIGGVLAEECDQLFAAAMKLEKASKA